MKNGKLLTKIIMLICALTLIFSNNISCIQLHASELNKVRQDAIVSNLNSYEGNSIVNTSDHIYSFVEMQEDLDFLYQKYPDYIDIEILGTSVDERNLYQVIIGNPEANNAIYIQSTCHGREWMNTWLLMRELENCLNNWDMPTTNGKTYGQNFNNCCIYFLPMINPDGVTISQYGIEGIKNFELRTKLYQMPGSHNTSRWKTNANGVDLNRQFSTGWNNRIDAKGPASENYNGIAPFTEPEVIVIKDVLNSRNFNAAISYHSMEGAIYWDLSQKGEIREQTRDLANYMQLITGYKLGEKSPLKGLEYNYMIYEKNIPTVVIETGSIMCPLPYSQFEKIWNENQNVMIRLVEKYQVS